jgi:hypothetical protein
MEEDRRSNYRAHATESRPATLVVGERRCSGYILDESSGGLCFLAISNFPVEENAQGELAETSDVPIAVRVAYVEESSLRTRIGLRRDETKLVRGRGFGGAFRSWAVMATVAALAGAALGLLMIRGPQLF